MYFTSGSDRAFEQLMQQRPGADHFDSGDAGAPEDCGEPDLMEHSDELTFADYFNAEKEIYRNITCAALAARWLLDHGFVMPTDAEIKELVAEANRKVLEAWGEIYALAVLKWLDGQ